MKKIPTLFKRVFDGHKIVDILPEITPGCAEAFIKGEATIKHDGSCCAMIDGVLYKRYDAKGGKTPPAGAIPCGDPDPVTGHHPHWVPVDLSLNNPGDKWFVKAYDNSIANGGVIRDGTYEAVGPHFQGNPYALDCDKLFRHGMHIVYVERTFEGIKRWLDNHNEEGLVFWYNGEPVCKIKRSDFGLPWNDRRH